MVLLHGSQGCSTYMRRYISGHFREPVDIASSALSETQAVYGGAENLKQGIRNVVAKYAPAVLGVATTCLAETIGDDVGMAIAELLEEDPEMRAIEIIPVSTPSYSGGYMDGFRDSCVAILEKMASAEQSRADQGSGRIGRLNLFPGFLSPADIRYLKLVMAGFGLESMIVPDISETLDAGIGPVFSRIPAGGASVKDIRLAGSATASIELGLLNPAGQSAALLLERSLGVPARRLPIPMGIRYSDLLFEAICSVTGTPLPEKYQQERGRLVDAMVDAHKYLFGKRAVVYGEPDFVAALTCFLADVGVQPVVCASGGDGPEFRKTLEVLTRDLDETPEILVETDFSDIRFHSRAAAADLLIGSSKGNHIARDLDIPLVRLGYPIHDRIGGQRILHVGYAGALNLLDILTNTLIAKEQEHLGYGYSYM